MLIFAKSSLKRFIYDLTELFMFPIQKTKKIYDKYQVDDVYVYQILTDTDSTSLQFLFFCQEENTIPENMFRKIIFEVIINNEILKRFDVSHEFWEQFGVRNEKTKKILGLFKLST